MNAHGRNFAANALPKPAHGKLRLTLSQAFGLSLALHLALAAPLVLLSRSDPVNSAETLVVDLDGLLADWQDEAKNTSGSAQPQTAPPPEQQRQAEQAPTPPAPPPQKQEEPEELSDSPPQRQPAREEAEKARQTPPSPPEARALSLSEEGQAARTMSRGDDQEDAIRKYGARLIKQVQARMIIPKKERASGASGEVKVSFAIAADGSVNPASLKLLKSSGRPGLDAAALAAVGRSAPFPPPPETTTVAISLVFGKK